jgi:hypothetical protein
LHHALRHFVSQPALLSLDADLAICLVGVGLLTPAKPIFYAILNAGIISFIHEQIRAI